MASLRLPTPPPTSPHDAEPPAYKRTDDTPAYELDELPLDSGRRTGSSLDASQIEACAPKPAPSRFRPHRKVLIWIGIGAVGILALVAGLIWYGVSKKKAEGQPARMSLAETIERPEVPASLLASDGSLVTSLTFGAPTISTLPFGPASEGNFSAYISSSLPVRLSPTESTFVKIFGESFYGATFVRGTNESETDVVIGVEALWRTGAGGNETVSMDWGIRQVNQTKGGVYSGNGASSAGFVLTTSTANLPSIPNQVYALDPLADKTGSFDVVTYNVTVTLPQSFSSSGATRNLAVWTDTSTRVEFADLGNLTFSTIDIRAPNGHVGGVYQEGNHYLGPICTSLSIHSGYAIYGPWSPLLNVTLVTSDPVRSTSWGSTIQATLTFPTPPPPTSAASSDLFYATALSARVVSSGWISINVTSIPSLKGLDLQAVSTNDTVDAHFLLPSNFQSLGTEIDYRLATNEREDKARATTEVDRQVLSSLGEGRGTRYSSAVREGGRLMEGKADWTAGVTGVSSKERGRSKVWLDAAEGEVRLALGTSTKKAYSGRGNLVWY